MRVVVSLPRSDGQWSEVGMNLRTVIGPYKQEWRMIQHARHFACGQRARLEWFTDSILGSPFKITYLNN